MCEWLGPVIVKEQKLHVAHCVAPGVVNQGKAVEEAQDNLREAVELYPESSGNIPGGREATTSEMNQNCKTAQKQARL
jgi:predicted RNase H-like HicB family nuclease